MQLESAAMRASIKWPWKRHPIFAYFALAIAVSWLAVLAVIGPRVFVGAEESPAMLSPQVFVAMYTGPLVAGMVMTALVHGRPGFHQLRKRLFHRASARWCAIALLGVPILVTVLLSTLSLFAPGFTPTIMASDDKLALAITGIAAGLATGICEELGWTGFAVPELRRRHSILMTGLIVGFVWGLWHVPLFASANISSPPFMRMLLLLALAFSFLPPFRILMVWVYERTQSLLVVIAMHASLTATTLIFQPVAIAGLGALTYDLVLASVLWLLVAAVGAGRTVSPARAAVR